MKLQLKIYGILAAVMVLIIAALFTIFTNKCTADDPNAVQVTHSNAVTMVKDSLETLYIKEKIALRDSMEAEMLTKAQQSDKTIDNLRKSLKAEQTTVATLKRDYQNNPTLRNCTEVVQQQDRIIDKQYQVIDSLDAEAQQWCELYDNENASGILKDTLISKKERTIAEQQQQFSTVASQLRTVDAKLASASWAKRNWLWVTGSYRNWLKSR